jgi:uncharacterized metal-binding protein YceD (DUF177 family)
MHFDSSPSGTYDARAMDNLLQDRRTPAELAACGQVIEISGKLSDLEHLAEIVRSDLETLDTDKLPLNWRESPLAGQLSFGFTAAQDGVPSVAGQASVTIPAVCQRCLGLVEIPLAVELRLILGGDVECAADDERYEMWELDEETLRPLDLLEEVLIMAMPLAATHVDDAVCKQPSAVAEAVRKTTRPFAMLKSQMEQED